MPPDNSIRRELARVGSAIRARTASAGALRWAALALGVWLPLCLADNALALPAGLRLALGAATAALCVAELARRVVRPCAARAGAERTARTLERVCLVPRNALINACQFESQSLGPVESGFARAVVAEGWNRLAGLPAGPVRLTRELRRWGALALGAAALWAAYACVLPRHAANAVARYAMPLGDVPPAGSVAISVSPDRDVTVFEGDTVEVRAVVASPRRRAGGAAPPPAPVLLWGPVAEDLKASQESMGERTAMRPLSAGGAADARQADYLYAFAPVSRSFAFRVAAGGTYSRCVRVSVLAQPRITASAFRVLPPPYLGLAEREEPGPPASVSAPAGSALEARLALDQPVSSVLWTAGADAAPFARAAGGWTARCGPAKAGPYEVSVTHGAAKRASRVAAGDVGLKPDLPPQAEFETDDRNRLANPGEEIALAVTASDDYGLREVAVVSREAELDGGAQAPTNAAARAHKTWTYAGPPGPPGTVKERFTLTLDPARFEPGRAYVVEAVARDFNPAGAAGRSRPLVLRVKSWKDLAVPPGDAFEGAFGLLRQTIARQAKAQALTGNLAAHVEEALGGGTVPKHREEMAGRQSEAQQSGRLCQGAFAAQGSAGRAYVTRVEPLVEGEMSWALRDIAKLAPGARPPLDERLRGIDGRQAYILRELIAMLGELSRERQGQPAARAQEKPERPAATARDAREELRDDLAKFERVQERLVRMSRTLMDKAPEDLTEKEEAILGQLAREEAQWAKFLEETLTDFSKLPLQDFSDGAQAKEINEVYQDVKRAAESLYQKKVELAVPQEQAGLEKAERIMHNLERWLASAPDAVKWSMEEPPAPADIPLAELPAEMEDIVGDLLDREEDMDEQVEDVTSSWADSLDKGAGWDAMDGPISSMSAKGVTGNLLPNQQEIGGRAGEGRTGRSHGQFVEQAAEGKDGRTTPTRLTPSPFEPGTVKDETRGGKGGATGGGKLSGFDRPGLHGPAPTPRVDGMARLAGEQAAIRQEAEALTLRLRALHLPSGDFEAAVAHMRRFEAAARAGDGMTVRRTYSRIMDALETSRDELRVETGVRRERTRLTPRERDEIMAGLRDGTPRGYEEMVSRYFRVLAEKEERK